MTAHARIEFGDFQTPRELADEVVRLLANSGIKPNAIVEPTCGKGSFVLAAADVFRCDIWGFELNEQYLAELQQKATARVRLQQQNFFTNNWTEFLATLPDDFLILGNPPWVTNSALSAIGGSNLPQKANFQSRTGLAAITGKANFDISEWMLIKLTEAVGKRRATIAMLCKTSTARKFLKHAWLTQMPVGQAAMYGIDAGEHFGAAVDACLLVCELNRAKSSQTAVVFDSLHAKCPVQTIGLLGKELVSNIKDYEEFSDLDGMAHYRWRSGVKHDAAKVMEFERNADGSFTNGLGESVELESEFMFPLLKSSDLGNGRIEPRKYVLLPQTHMGEDTAEIEHRANGVWCYLQRHAASLDHRGSSIYRDRHRFSIFGIGEYTFAPWKVGISGMYKSFRFSVVGPHRGKPTVMDDTCYIAACKSEAEAELLAEICNSEPAQKFLQSLAFPDSKRPLTTDILHRLDVIRAAERLGLASKARQFLSSIHSQIGQSCFVYKKDADDAPKDKPRKVVKRQKSPAKKVNLAS